MTHTKEKIRTQTALEAININHATQALKIDELEAMLAIHKRKLAQCLAYMRLAATLADSFDSSNLNAVLVQQALPEWALEEFTK
jgi:uncharacterized coiled-coil protein SlyX